MNNSNSIKKNLRKKPFSKNGLFYVMLTLIMSFFMFVYIDIALRYVVRNYYSSYSLFSITPILFTISIFIIFVLFMFLFKKVGRLVFFNIFFIVYFIFFIVNYFHYKYLARVVTFSDVFLAGEGTEQVTSLLSVVHWELITTVIIFVLFMIASNILLLKNNKRIINKKILLMLLILFVLVRIMAIISLGKNTNDIVLKQVNNKNIYITYNNPTRALIVSGTPEYIWKFIYVELKKDNNKKKDKEIIYKYINSNPYEHTNNNYTGIFKDKNVIYILSESIDSFLVTEEVMPTLYKMKNEGLNFTNRYAPAFGGGKTFNTEYAMLTGMYQPNEENAAYKYVNNTYKNTFPKMFKEKGYIVNSIHYNDDNFYNRKKIHRQIGFNNHYGNLNDRYNKDFGTFDSYLIKTNETYNEIVANNRFATLISTMSGHMPYNLSAPSCKKITNKYKQFNKYNGETRCLYAKAHETDEMLRLLIERLDKDKKLDDTVIIVVPDHQTYGYSNVKKEKHTNNENLITKVPFIIWNNNIKHKDIDIIMDTADILPTISNMFSLNYNPSFSTGTDIFSKEHDNYVFFRNGDWIDNKYHNIENSKKFTSYENNITSRIQQKIRINNLILSTDYYNKN